MSEMNSSREQDACFKQIVTAGWNNRSNGDVDSPFGHFALLTIEPNEHKELIGTVFDDDPSVPIEPGYYILVEDSQGFMHVFTFPTAMAANLEYMKLDAQYGEWLDSENE